MHASYNIHRRAKTTSRPNEQMKYIRPGHHMPLCGEQKGCLRNPKCYICKTYSPRGPSLPWIFPHEWPQVGIPILPPNPRGRQGATRIGLPRMRAAAKSCARSALNAKIAKTVFVLIISKVLPIFFWCFPVCFTDGLFYQKCT